MTQTILEAKKLSFHFPKHPLFTRVSFSIQAGEWVGIIGPNGSGKTTLLQLLLGFIKPQEGRVISYLSLDRIGFLPQTLPLGNDLPVSCLDVTLMGIMSELLWWGGFSKDTKRKALDALALVGMERKSKDAFSTLSGGQRRRVLLARALVSDPDILVLDEPTSGCDVASKKCIYELLQRLQGKKTLLHVTHDLVAITDKVDRILAVENGVQMYAPKEICEHFALGLYHEPLLNTPCRD